MQNKNYFFRIVCVAGLLLTLVFSSCRKETYYTKDDASLKFSQEILTFDTIFTTVVTITKRVMVYNPHSNTIKTNIRLMDGSSSVFSVNVDGVSGSYFTDVEIPAKDSIFIFVKATVNPNNINGAILTVDTLAFNTNGRRQHIALIAYGEDANFIIPDKKDGAIAYKIIAHANEHITWTKDKPYVIYGYAVVDSAATLTIEEGTRIYVHKEGCLWIYRDGCLQVNGTKDEPVVFQGDRRASAPKLDYEQWDKIWINEGSRDNKINYAIIKNARVGLYAQLLSQDLGNKLILTNSIIQSSSQYGLMCRNYRVDAYNNVIADCGEMCIALQGGSYSIINNTFYNKYAYSRNTPAAYCSDSYIVTDNTGQQTAIIGDFSCDFFNNIVYGNATNEFGYYNGYPNEVSFSLQIENCLIKAESKYLHGLTYPNSIINQDPLVSNAAQYDFSLQDHSPCKGKGKPVSLSEDIAGVTRGNPPSIGAYE